MITQTVTVHKVVPWSDSNDYEGEGEFVIPGRLIYGRVTVHSKKVWERITPGTRVEAHIWLDCVKESFEMCSPYEETKFVRKRALTYELTGKVIDTSELKESSQVWVDAEKLKVEVHMPAGSTHALYFSRLRRKDVIKVAGEVTFSIERVL